jgi:hypothetical protein
MAVSAVGGFALSLYKCHNELAGTMIEDFQVKGHNSSGKVMKQAPPSKPRQKFPRNPLKTPGHRKSHSSSSSLLSPLGVFLQFQQVDIVPREECSPPPSGQSNPPCRPLGGRDNGRNNESSPLHKPVPMSNADKRVNTSVRDKKGESIDILTYVGTGIVVGMAVGMGVGMGVGILATRRQITLLSTISSLLILICSATVSVIAYCCNYFLALHGCS